MLNVSKNNIESALYVSKNNIESACLIVVFGSDMTDSMILVYLTSQTEGSRTSL
jgi:hypothetical protein